MIELAGRAAALPGAAYFVSTWANAAETHDHVPTAPPELPLLQSYQPKFFDAADFAALRSFAEILIPTDDTPGAREARCAEFIDFLLQAAAEGAPEMQRQWRKAMSLLRDSGFHAADGAKRAQLVEEFSKPERDRTATHPAYSAYRLIKQQNTFAFYTSRAGIIENLHYRGNSYNAVFPACDHPEHQKV